MCGVLMVLLLVIIFLFFFAMTKYAINYYKNYKEPTEEEVERARKTLLALLLLYFIGHLDE